MRSMDKDGRSLFEQLRTLDTEQRNPQTKGIDLADPIEIVRLINNEDRTVADAVATRLPEIALAVEKVALSLAAGGKLFYFGAGTSGRLGVLDAAECPPTFGTDPETVQGYIAGGREAMFVAQEGAEDLESNGVDALRHAGCTTIDVVCGLAASGRTPYVHGALKAAQDLGATTIFVTTVPRRQLEISADVIIDVPVGPEVIMGSTRMKSATAQKMILNMITTGAMIRRGKVYENVMVDLLLTNRKLVERAKRIITTFSDISYTEAEKLLSETEGNVKVALFMALSGADLYTARDTLNQHNGFIREAILAYE